MLHSGDSGFNTDEKVDKRFKNLPDYPYSSASELVGEYNTHLL
jgi:hypothetical protein